MKRFGFNRVGAVACLAVAAVVLIVIIIGQAAMSNSGDQDGYAPGAPVSRDGQAKPNRQEGQTAISSDRAGGADISARPVVRPADRPDPPAPPGTAAEPESSASTAHQDIPTLWRRGDSESARELGDIAKTDPDEYLQLKAVVALGQMDRNEAIVQLVETLTASDDWRVQVRARTVLLRRLGLRFGNPPGPTDEKSWAKMVATIRALPGVKAAYAARRERYEGRP